MSTEAASNISSRNEPRANSTILCAFRLRRALRIIAFILYTSGLGTTRVVRLADHIAEASRRHGTRVGRLHHHKGLIGACAHGIVDAGIAELVYTTARARQGAGSQ